MTHIPKALLSKQRDPILSIFFFNGGKLIAGNRISSWGI